MAGLEYFLTGLDVLPAGPSLGTAVTSSASADTYGSYIQFIASASEDLYIVGITVNTNDVGYVSYAQIAVAIGAAASEVVKAVINIPLTRGMLQEVGTKMYCGEKDIKPFLKIPSGSRVALKIADNIAGALGHSIVLHYIPVANASVETLGAVASVTGNVGGNITGSIGSLASQAQTDVKSAMTSQGYTATRATYLDSAGATFVKS